MTISRRTNRAIWQQRDATSIRRATGASGALQERVVMFLNPRAAPLSTVTKLDPPSKTQPPDRAETVPREIASIVPPRPAALVRTPAAVPRPQDRTVSDTPVLKAPSQDPPKDPVPVAPPVAFEAPAPAPNVATAST